MRRIVVTGIGLVSPLGADRETTWSNACLGRSGVRRVLLETYDESLACLGAPAAHSADTAAMVVAEAVASANATASRSSYSPPNNSEPYFSKAPDRQTLLANLVATQAVADARLEEVCRPSAENTRFGCAVSTSKPNLELFRECWGRQQANGEIDPVAWMGLFPGTLAAQIASNFGIAGPSSSPVAACATGLHAVIKAAQWIADGTCDIALAGCADASLNAPVVASYQRMGVLASDRFDTPEQAVRPFSADRQGFVVGEGAAMFVLEDEQHARSRGANIYGELAGWALASDAYSLTDLSDDAQSMAHCIRSAMGDAVHPQDIGHINFHGTATAANDRWEVRAIKHVFGKSAAQLRCTANKSMTGHLLGASGGVELAVTLLALKHQFIPPTLNLHQPDSECDLDFTPHTGRPHQFRAALKLSLGFGGHLAAIVVRTPESENPVP